MKAGLVGCFHDRLGADGSGFHDVGRIEAALDFILLEVLDKSVQVAEGAGDDIFA